jgi:hypothetical protein
MFAGLSQSRTRSFIRAFHPSPCMSGLHMGCKACCRGEQRECPNGSTRAPFLASQSSNLSALRRQTVEGRCPLGCPRRRQCPEPHAASPRPRRSGRCFEATPRSRSRRCCSRRSANRARGASYPERLPAKVRRESESPPPVPPRVLAWLELEAAEQASRFKEVLEPTLRRFRPERLSFDSILASGEVIHQCSPSLAPRFAKVRCPSNTTSLSQPRRAGVAPQTSARFSTMRTRPRQRLSGDGISSSGEIRPASSSGTFPSAGAGSGSAPRARPRAESLATASRRVGRRAGGRISRPCGRRQHRRRPRSGSAALPRVVRR